MFSMHFFPAVSFSRARDRWTLRGVASDAAQQGRRQAGVGRGGGRHGIGGVRYEGRVDVGMGLEEAGMWQKVGFGKHGVRWRQV